MRNEDDMFFSHMPSDKERRGYHQLSERARAKCVFHQYIARIVEGLVARKKILIFVR